MQKEIKNLEFVQGVNFEFIDSLKNNGTKYLLIFDDSCEEICNSNRGQTIDYVIAQTVDLFHQNFIFPNV